jgi:hypothetical protein
MREVLSGRCKLLLLVSAGATVEPPSAGAPCWQKLGVLVLVTLAMASTVESSV